MMKDHQQASGRSPEAFMAIFYVIYVLGKAGREAKEAVTPHARPGINLPPADRM